MHWIFKITQKYKWKYWYVFWWLQGMAILYDGNVKDIMIELTKIIPRAQIKLTFKITVIIDGVIMIKNYLIWWLNEII